MTKKQMKQMGIEYGDFDVILEDEDIVYDEYVLINEDEEEEE